MKNLIRLFPALVLGGFLLASCEGPMGPQGVAGTNGTDGVDANETCKECHNQEVVNQKKLEYEHSMHAESSDLAEEEGTRNTCAPCHSHQGFLSVVKNNTPATFTANPSDPTKYIINYMII
jgi:nitrate reductase cytochrome c-type subunit